MNFLDLDSVPRFEGRDIEDLFGKIIHGLRIDSLSIYQDHEKTGEISVQEDTFKIHQTFKNPKIKPIIDFIFNYKENI